MANIVQAKSSAALNHVRSLMCAFVDWHRTRHIADIELVDRYFDEAKFEQELAALPGKYASPKGRLLIAYDVEQPAGCVALHDLGQGICEMKRMFVPAGFRGLGIGRALVDRIIADARKAGYRRMRLDTSRHQTEAIRLYEKSGFKRVSPYYEVDKDLKKWLLFFELQL